MKHFNTRNRLIERTIEVIAESGLDKTTTKAIVNGTSINEAYIYRFFKNKEDLLSYVFEELDEELVTKMMQHVEVMYMQELEYELRCRIFFEAVWKFILGNKEKCWAFIRYYYSPYFNKYSAVGHKKRYVPLVKKFSEAFVEEANVWMLLNHILNVMLYFAVKVFSGAVDNNDDTAEHVFRLVYYSIRPYLKRKDQDNWEGIMVCRYQRK